LIHAEPKYMQGEIIVQGSRESIETYFQNTNITIENIISHSHDIFHIQLQDKNVNLETLVQDIKKNIDIKFATVNRIYQIKDTPKDTHWLSQWALDNIGQNSPRGLPGTENADIAALRAWKETKGSRDIIVAVIDTGIDYTHPDLKDNIWQNEKEINGIDGVDDDGNGYTDDKYGWNFITIGQTKPYYGKLGSPDPMDDHSHGTHCAGIIGAVPNNNIGIAGVNWNIRLMALKFLSKMGSGTSIDAYRAILYAIDNKADILSNSWGGGDRDELLEFAIQKAKDNGILFIAAAGNSAINTDHTPHYPSTYEHDNVISVAASDNNDQLAVFSNYGAETVDIAAPGVDIMSTVPVALNEKSRLAYASYSGTSMATPYVSGVAALVLAKNPELKRKPLELKQRLLDTVDILPAFAGRVKSCGRLNAYRAVINDKNIEETEFETKEHACIIEAPQYNEEAFDKVWTLEAPDVQATHIRIHFEWLEADIPDVDLIAVYDQDYRLIFQFEKQYPAGMWTHWIPGNKAYVRFANATITIETMVEQEFSNPNEGFKNGAIYCRQDPMTQKTFCYLSQTSGPLPNFESKGFKIDKIEYKIPRPKKDKDNNKESK
jgi:subtilisin family serine protease